MKPVRYFQVHYFYCGEVSFCVNGGDRIELEWCTTRGNEQYEISGHDLSFYCSDDTNCNIVIEGITTGQFTRGVQSSINWYKRRRPKVR